MLPLDVSLPWLLVYPDPLSVFLDDYFKQQEFPRFEQLKNLWATVHR